GVLVGGLMFHPSPGQRDVMPGVSPGSQAQQDGARTDTAEPNCKPTVECSDGTMSCSSGSGTCSGHGGIKRADTASPPTVECADGTLSSSSGSGTCSDHGGEAKTLVERAPTKKEH